MTQTARSAWSKLLTSLIALLGFCSCKSTQKAIATEPTPDPALRQSPSPDDEATGTIRTIRRQDEAICLYGPPPVIRERLKMESHTPQTTPRKKAQQ